MKTVRKLLSLSKKPFLGKLGPRGSMGLIAFTARLFHPFSGKNQEGCRVQVRQIPGNKPSLDHLCKIPEGAAVGRRVPAKKQAGRCHLGSQRMHYRCLEKMGDPGVQKEGENQYRLCKQYVKEAGGQTNHDTGYLKTAWHFKTNDNPNKN